MTRVKICGLTEVSDAVSCVEMGVDYLGLIFVAGSRLVRPSAARDIRDTVPNARLVGVFADHAAEDVVMTATEYGLNVIQLHGDENDHFVKEVAWKTGLPIIKAQRAGETVSRTADYLLFDLPKRREPDPSERDRLWAQARQAVADGRKVFLAGKLTSDNVAEAITQVAPFAVDVASGVERSAGIKSIDAMRSFIREVRRVRN